MFLQSSEAMIALHSVAFCSFVVHVYMWHLNSKKRSMNCESSFLVKRNTESSIAGIQKLTFLLSSNVGFVYPTEIYFEWSHVTLYFKFSGLLIRMYFI